MTLAPPKGRWEHSGIVERFVYGSWPIPPIPVEYGLTRALRWLYAERVDADEEVARRIAHEREVLCYEVCPKDTLQICEEARPARG